jgi:hypothetical protein
MSVYLASSFDSFPPSHKNCESGSMYLMMVFPNLNVPDIPSHANPSLMFELRHLNRKPYAACRCQLVSVSCSGRGHSDFPGADEMDIRLEMPLNMLPAISGFFSVNRDVGNSR